MGIYLRLKSSLLIVAALACGQAFGAPISKTVTMPSASSLFTTGSAVLDTGQLTVSALSGEYIPAAASESRALASISKGISVPSTGIASALKSGLKANAASLVLSATVAAAIAGVDWLMTDGVLVKKTASSDPLATTPVTDNNFSTRCTYIASVGGGVYYSGGFTYVVSSAPYTSSGFSYIGNCSEEAGLYVSSYPGIVATTTPATTAVSDSDYSVLDGFVQGKDGVWQQSLVNDLCKGSTNFEQCVSDMGGKPKLAGPSTVTSTPVTTSTTTTNPDGTQTITATTSKTDYQLGYPGGSVVDITPTTTSSTTTTQQDATGATTSTSTSTTAVTTTSTTPTTTTSDGTYTDTDFPDVPSFYEQKYPNGFKGVWSDNKDALTNSPFITFLKGFVPSFSGTCPTFGLSFDIMPHANYGYIQFNSLCYIFDFVKVIVLVTAMFTCRALIFGG